MQLELPEGLIFDDPESLQERVRRVYVACTQAVNDELARKRQGSNGKTPVVDTRRAPAASPNGNGASNGHRASQKQITFIRQLAGQISGLGVRRFDTLAEKMFGKPMADLGGLDVSGQIDVLKAIRAGDIDRDTALNGVTP